MNAPIQTLRTRSTASFAGLLLLVSTLAGVGGCADIHRAVSLPPVNPESPVAAAVTAASAKTYARPSLYDIPPTPKNVPSAPVLKAGVFEMVRCRRAMYAYAAAHPPLTTGTEAFGTEQRQYAQFHGDEPPAPDAELSREDLAARLKAFAAPPAPIGAKSAPAPASAPAAASPAAPAAQTAVAGPAAALAPADQASDEEAGPGAPPLPAPGHDPLLARCT